MGSWRLSGDKAFVSCDIGYLFMQLRSSSTAQHAGQSSDEDSGEDSMSADLGDGSSDDDDYSSTSSVDDDDIPAEPLHDEDEDDATVAQWRRNSYSAATVVPLLLSSKPNYNVTYV